METINTNTNTVTVEQAKAKTERSAKTKLIAITSAISVGVCCAGFIPAIVIVAQNKGKGADIDPAYKTATTNSNGITVYPVKLSSPMSSSNQLSATITNVPKDAKYTIKVDGVGATAGQSIAFVMVEMLPISGYEPHTGDTLNFYLNIQCSSQSSNGVLWTSEVKDLSATWGDTTADVDEDHDGLTANIDLNDNDNSYKGNINMMGVTMDFGFKMNYKELFDTVFSNDASVKDAWNDNLAKLGSLLASHVYSVNRVVPEDCNMVYDYKTEDGLYKQIGCTGYENFHIKSENGTDENDIVYAETAYRKFKDSTITGDNKEYKVIFLSIQGTSNNQEWMSNFDVGTYDKDTSDSFNYLASGETIDQVHPDWHNYRNIKGQDVTANRLWKKMFEGNDSWCARNKIDLATDNVILFTCGHSRGGAISNLIGARFVDEVVPTATTNKLGNITYCYASPFTTDTIIGMSDKYNSIHCVVTGDDFVGKVPFEKWGLQRYGRIHTIQIGQDEAMLEKYNNEWKARDPNMKGYKAFDFWTDNVETMPVHNRYELYKCVEGSKTTSSIPEDLDKINAIIASNKKVLGELGIHDRYVEQKPVETAAGSNKYYLETKVAGGAVVDLANNFFNGKTIDWTKIIAIVPLLQSYSGYVLPLGMNILLASVEGKNIMDVFNCNHSMVSYYFAAANMPSEQK